MHPLAYQVFENFLTPEDLATVRQSALTAGFGTWSPACDSVLKINNFAGVGYMGRHDIILKALAGRMGVAVFPREIKFRTTGVDAAKSYVHSDRSSGDFSAILYLSDEKDERSGTGFYHYAPNELWPHGLTAMPCYRELSGTVAGERLKRDMTTRSPLNKKIWKPTGFVRGLMNTCLVFRSDLFHARLPVEGLGETDETARMVHVTHFVI